MRLSMDVARSYVPSFQGVLNNKYAKYTLGVGAFVGVCLAIRKIWNQYGSPCLFPPRNQEGQNRLRPPTKPSRLRQVETEIEALKSQMEKAEGEVEALKSQMEKAKGEIEALKSQNEERQQEVRGLQRVSVTLGTNDAKLTKEHPGLNQRLERIEDLVSSPSGVSSLPGIDTLRDPLS